MPTNKKQLRKKNHIQQKNEIKGITKTNRCEKKKKRKTFKRESTQKEKERGARIEREGFTLKISEGKKKLLTHAKTN